MITLQSLYGNIKKFYPQLCNPFLQEYCSKSDDQSADRPFHYGYNSLKWLIYSFRDTQDSKWITKLFFNVLVEYKALEKSDYDLQHNILKWHCIDDLREQLQAQRPIPNVKDLPTIQLCGQTIVLNSTPHNLTSKIFRHTRADAILFRNDETGAAGIAFRVNGTMIKQKQKINTIFASLTAHETGWHGYSQGETYNLLIHHGTKEGASSNVTIDMLSDILLDVFNQP